MYSISGGYILQRNPYWWLRRCLPYFANETFIIRLSHPIKSDDHRESAMIIWRIHFLCVITIFDSQIRKMEKFPVRGIPYWKTLLFIELGKINEKSHQWGKKIWGVGANVPFATLYRSWAWGTIQICVYSRLSLCRLKQGIKLAATVWLVRKRYRWSWICKQVVVIDRLYFICRSQFSMKTLSLDLWLLTTAMLNGPSM